MYCFQRVVPPVFSTEPALPAQLPAGFFTVSSAPWESLQMNASWMAGEWALCLQALVQAGVCLISQSQEQESSLMKLFLVTSSKINNK